jgi:hypothetical protein
MAAIERERKRFLTTLCGEILGRVGRRPSMADADSATSVQISEALLGVLAAGGYRPNLAIRLGGQEVGAAFDGFVAEYVRRTFKAKMTALRPGHFEIKSGVHIRDTAQYAHLQVLRDIYEDPAVVPGATNLAQFRAAVAPDYQVQADVVVLRRPETAPAQLLSLTSNAARSTPLLRRAAGQLPLLHANVSCKWTFRSDRAQNIRTEAIALMRHRKGPMPHMVVVTAEPLPSRLRSIAIGTGEVDCVYHAALPELEQALHNSRAAAQAFRNARARSARVRALDEQISTFELMSMGDRLRDISDLPFDLAS